MTSYWWECEKCGAHVDFPTATSSRGIAHFIRFDRRCFMGCSMTWQRGSGAVRWSGLLVIEWVIGPVARLRKRPSP